MTLTIGVDIGGTNIAGAVVDEDGQILAHARRQSPATHTDKIEEAVFSLVGELRESHQVEAVGVAAAGFIDKQRATVMFAANLAWRQVPLRAHLENGIGLPVVIENDANAAAWGEFTFGAGKDTDDLLLVTVGTGIGGGMVLDGELMRGAFGVAAEIGHLRVVPGGRACGCGNLGCWETYGSGSALVRQTREQLAAGSLLGRDLLDRANGDIDAVTGPMVTDAAREGDAFAIEQLTELGRWLGEGIASLVAVLDPAMVAIGGGVSEACDLLLDPIRDAFGAQLTGRGYRPVAEIRLAELGNRAGQLGAADLGRRR
ncbi:MAG: ROK family glucokinase [Marmoricola sp.]